MGTEVNEIPSMGIIEYYSSTVLYREIRPAESIHQAIDILSTLNEVMNGIFGKIQARVDQEKTRLDAISSRITTAQSKVKSITGSTQATLVISPSHYPAPEWLPPYKPINVPGASHKIKRHHYHLDPELHPHVWSPHCFADI